MDSKKVIRQKRLAVERDYWRRCALLNCAADEMRTDDDFRHIINLARAIQNINH